MKPFATLALMPIVLLCGCQGNWSTEVSVPKVAIQEAVDAWLPVKLSDYIEDEKPVEVALSKATVLLREGTDKIGVEMNVTVDLPSVAVPGRPTPAAESPPPGLPGLEPAPTPPTPVEKAAASDGKMPAKTVQGTVVVSTGIRYEPESASFFCQYPATERIDIEHFPSELEPLLSKLSEEAMTRYFAENSVYTIDDSQTATRLAKSAIKNVTIRDGKLIIEVGF